MTLTWTIKPFADLTPTELYALLHLRAEVFVVEQNCPYLDVDHKDQQGIHVLGYAPDGRLAAYARVFPPGVTYADYACIGRVVTAPFARGKGLGKPLVDQARETLFVTYGVQPIKISAQAHLQNFYGTCGFVGTGELYLEDGIPHRAMVYEPEG